MGGLPRAELLFADSSNAMSKARFVASPCENHIPMMEIMALANMESIAHLVRFGPLRWLGQTYGRDAGWQII